MLSTNKNISGANSYSISLYTVECGAIVIASCLVTACVQCILQTSPGDIFFLDQRNRLALETLLAMCD